MKLMKEDFRISSKVKTLGIIAAVISTPTLSHAAISLNPGANQIMIDQVISGVTVSRTVHIRTPTSYDGTESLPLLFGFHGSGGTGQGFANNPTLNALINSGEFVGVYANGHNDSGGMGGFWNLGSENTSADDVAFVSSIFQELAMTAGLDTATAFAFGSSNGGGMVNLLGKSINNFSGIAPFYSQQTTLVENLIPPNELSVFQLNGATDGLIPVGGGSSPVTSGLFLSAEDSALNWVNNFGYSTTPTSETLTWGTESIDSFTYADPNSNREVRYMIAADTGHSGFDDATARALQYTEMWSFFEDSIVPVPEPSTGGLILLGSLLGVARRKRC